MGADSVRTANSVHFEGQETHEIRWARRTFYRDQDARERCNGPASSISARYRDTPGMGRLFVSQPVESGSLRIVCWYGRSKETSVAGVADSNAEVLCSFPPQRHIPKSLCTEGTNRICGYILCKYRGDTSKYTPRFSLARHPSFHLGRDDRWQACDPDSSSTPGPCLATCGPDSSWQTRNSERSGKSTPSLFHRRTQNSVYDDPASDGNSVDQYQ